MQAILFLAIFSFFFTMVTAFTLNISQSSNALTQERAEQTRNHFRAIENVILNKFTPENLSAFPPGITNMTALMNTQEINNLAIATDGSPTKDAWNRDFLVHSRSENLALGATATAPVLGISLISAGPDGIMGSYASPTTIASLLALTPQNDNILYTFTNETAQQRNLDILQQELKSIARAMEDDFNQRYQSQRVFIETGYANWLKDNSNLDKNINQYLLSSAAISMDSNSATKSKYPLIRELENWLPDLPNNEFNLTFTPISNLETQLILNRAAGSTNPWISISLRTNARGSR
jgi:hypothetical protein